jgi:hypothetical protein
MSTMKIGLRAEQPPSARSANKAGVNSARERSTCS